MNPSTLVRNARGDTVTEDRLTESSSGGILSTKYDSILSYLDDCEQPHHIFPIQVTVLGDDGIGGVHQHLTITDAAIRLTSSEVDSRIEYQSLENVGFGIGSGSEFKITLSGVDAVRSYELWNRFEKSELEAAVDYIRGRRRGH